MTYNILSKRKQILILKFGEEMEEVVNIFCTEFAVYILTQRGLYKIGYYGIQKIEKINLADSGQTYNFSSKLSVLKNKMLMLLSKNNKEFQMFDLGTGKLVSLGTSDSPFVFITNVGTTVMATTKSQLIYWKGFEKVSELNHPFISAIVQTSHYLITGDIKERILVFSVEDGTLLRNINHPKLEEESDILLSISTAGIHCLLEYKGYIFSATHKAINIWRLDSYDQNKPLQKIKTCGIAVQIHRYNTVLYFNMKNVEGEFAEILSITDSTFRKERKVKRNPTEFTSVKMPISPKSHGPTVRVKTSEDITKDQCTAEEFLLAQDDFEITSERPKSKRFTKKL